MEKLNHKIAMSGATGFVGSHLRNDFRQRSWDVVPLGRKDFAVSAEVLAGKMEGSDIVVNLAGAPVIGRWTEEYKKVMYESRIQVTKSLVSACAQMDQKPGLFISTSAVGYYASDGSHTEEEYRKADDFLGRLAEDWEREALRARDHGMRTVIFRFGIVLGKEGGALQKMLVPFKLGLGGMIGDGSQPFSWVHIKDLSRAYETIIDNPAYEGIYNLTAPNPTTNKGLTTALGRALGRPTVFRVPRFVLKLQLGEGAQVLASGQHVIPKRLLDSGFTFQFQDIGEAVKDCVT